LLRAIPKLLPGLALAIAVAALAWVLSALLKPYLLLEPLVIAILLGIGLAAAIGSKPVLKPGTTFAARTILELAIVLLGFKLSFAKLAALGAPVLIAVLMFVPVIVLAAIPLGRLFGLPLKLAVLIGVGSGICGSSAIAAVAPCIGADDEDAALAVSGLSVLGAVAVLVYAAVCHALALTDGQYGVWAGLSLQAVPNALAAAFARSDVAGEAGTIVKMARVALLAPIALGLALWFRPMERGSIDPQSPQGPARDGDAADGRAQGPPASRQEEEAALKRRAPGRVPIPLYVILFIAAAALNSTGMVRPALTMICANASALLMVVAMAALGLGVDFASLRKRAGPALAMSCVLFLAVAASAYAWSAWVVPPR
jgi:uncharacterized integral membrane protein (TIGR00698 family)